MLFLGRLLRVVFVLLVVRLVLRAVAAFVRARAAPPRANPGPERSAAGAELVKDRVCNTFLPRLRALRALVAGREEHFCSAACRDKALVEVSRAS